MSKASRWYKAFGKYESRKLTKKGLPQFISKYGLKEYKKKKRVIKKVWRLWLKDNQDFNSLYNNEAHYE